MGRGIDSSAAINAQPATITEYGLDPRGWGMFRSLSGVLHRGIAGTETPVVIDRVSQFGGWGHSPQRFAGLDGLSAGRQRPVTQSNSVLSAEKSATTEDAALRVFAERLGRRQ